MLPVSPPKSCTWTHRKDYSWRLTSGRWSVSMGSAANMMTFSDSSITAEVIKRPLCSHTGAFQTLQNTFVSTELPPPKCVQAVRKHFPQWRWTVTVIGGCITIIGKNVRLIISSVIPCCIRCLSEKLTRCCLVIVRRSGKKCVCVYVCVCVIMSLSHSALL